MYSNFKDVNTVDSIIGPVNIRHSTTIDTERDSANRLVDEASPTEADVPNVWTYSCRYQYNGEQIKPITKAQISRLKHTREKQFQHRFVKRTCCPHSDAFFFTNAFPPQKLATPTKSSVCRFERR